MVVAADHVPGLGADAGRPRPGGHINAFLRCRHHHADAPFVLLHLRARQPADRIRDQQRGRVAQQRAQPGQIGRDGRRAFIVDDEHRPVALFTQALRHRVDVDVAAPGHVQPVETGADRLRDRGEASRRTARARRTAIRCPGWRH